MNEIEVRVNGQPEVLADAAMLSLLARYDITLETHGVAVALNGTVLPRNQWDATRLNASDRIEIVHARQGG